MLQLGTWGKQCCTLPASMPIHWIRHAMVKAPRSTFHQMEQSCQGKTGTLGLIRRQIQPIRNRFENQSGMPHKCISEAGRKEKIKKMEG